MSQQRGPWRDKNMGRRWAILAVSIPALCVSVSGGESESSLRVDGERAKTYVTYLGSDAMLGRVSCTDGYRVASEWAATRFKEWGLKPAGEDGTFFQKVKIRDFDWNVGVPSLEVAGRTFPFDDGDFSVDGLSTPGITLQAEIVFVGYGISAPEKGLNEYDGLDVGGKIVLVLTGSPKDAPEMKQRFQPAEKEAATEKAKEQEEWKEESSELSKIRTANAKGAAAIMLYNPDETRETEARRDSSSPSSEKRPFKPEKSFLCFRIHERVFRAIMKHDPQESPQGLKRRMDFARREIKQKRPQSRRTGVKATLKGYDVSVRYDEEHGNNIDRNVLAKIEGTDPTLKNEYVLAGAHLDGIGVRNGYVCNGADDNASGSAVVLEIARVLSEGKFQPKRTVIFCCWCGEERGLLGSLHYTSQPCDGVVMDKVAAYFNLDMVGMGEELGAPGALNFPTIWDVIKRNQDAEVLKRVKPLEGGPSGSDHTGFIRRGIEALALMSSGGVGHPDYHQPEDDTGKIESQMLRVAGQFVLQGMVNLANETDAKLLIERREQLYQGMRMQVQNLNPELPNSRWMVVPIAQKTKEALYDEVYNRARELFRNPPSPADSRGRATEAGQGGPVKKSIARGLAEIKAIGGDTRLLQLLLDLHAIGRVDLKGDDGVWIAQGRLTSAGREALKTLEAGGVVVRLVSPEENLINDLLSAAAKPFIITGDYQITDAMVDQLNDRGVRLGINLDPQKVQEFITRVEKAKQQLGERKNLFGYLTSVRGLEEARRPLYLGLIDSGWTHREICGGPEHQGLLGGGNLGTLVGK